MSSQDYWRKREEEWLEECEKQERKWFKEIEKIYEDMLSEIEEQIAVWYQRYGDANGLTMQQAKEFLSKTDTEWYAKRAKEYCRLAQLDRDEGTKKREKIYFSQLANEEMSRYNTTMKINRLKMIESQIKLRILNAQSNVEARMEEMLIEASQQEVERMAGILGDTVFDNWKGAEAIAKASFHGATFSQRIWGEHQSNLQKALNRALENSIILGKNPKALVKDFKAVAGGTTKQAQRLLRTESSRVRMETQKQSFINSGFDEFEFMANPKCCPHCQEINGTHYETEKMDPGFNAPPLHPNCRCYVSPYIDRNKEPKDSKLWDEWAETYDEHGLSWGEWKARSQTKSLDMMGQAKQIKVNFGKGKYKVHEADKALKIYTQTNSKDAQESIKNLQMLLPKYYKEFGELDSIILMKNSDIPGIAAYDHNSNKMYVNESLFDSRFIDKNLNTSYFAAKSSEDVLLHEFTHKAHWDAVIKEYNSNKKYGTIEEAKQSLEGELRSYLKSQIAYDPMYIMKIISVNAYDGYYKRGSLNELVADTNVLLKSDSLYDNHLKDLIANIL